MRLNIQHTTTFTYDAPITETATEARLQPANVAGAPQRCHDFMLVVSPATAIHHYVDFFGNHVHHFTLLPPHQEVVITATSLVETGPGLVPAQPDETIMRHDYLRESHFVRFAPTVRAFAETISAQTDPASMAETIARRINETLIYETGVTDVSSTSDEVMALGRGVCQDFAHSMLAICRLRGLPARYISGYLYGGPETEQEIRASHAWCEVFCGEERGWLAFDPTHDTIIVDERYVRVGTGRDYADVAPVRGTFRGVAHEQLRVEVRITTDRQAALRAG